jgi:nucleotide-binding universal stress UspA family protein
MGERDERIVVGIDGSALAAAGLRWAVREAQLRGASVEVVHAWTVPLFALQPDAPARLPVIEPEQLEAAAQHELDAAVADARALAPAVDVTGAVIGGHAAEVLCEQAKGASLVVVGSRGHGGFAGLVLGSVSSAVARHAPCPVAVVPVVERPAAGDRIIVGVDGSPAATAAIRWAFDEARRRGVGVDVIHSWGIPGSMYFGETAAVGPEHLEAAARAVLSETMAAVADEARGLDVVATVERGHPVDVLTARGASAALVVVGSRGHGGFTGLLLGSTSNGVVHHATCPTVIVHPTD